uniref:Uncharacterized protein n=1 Tax=Aegilops tauschii TaxID=37682 RepID=M8C6A3_AEGTA
MATASKEGEGGGWAAPQIECEVRRELDDGVMWPSPQGLPWPICARGQGCGGPWVAGEHEPEDERGAAKDAAASADCLRAQVRG